MSTASDSTGSTILAFIVGAAAGFMIKVAMDEYITQQTVADLMDCEGIDVGNT